MVRTEVISEGFECLKIFLDPTKKKYLTVQDSKNNDVQVL